MDGRPEMGKRGEPTVGRETHGHTKGKKRANREKEGEEWSKKNDENRVRKIKRGGVGKRIVEIK